MADFVHLHLHSEYSLLDGACKISEIPRRAKECGQSAVALTDHGVMYGAVAFYRACRAEGIKPIIGCEVYVAPGSRFDKTHSGGASNNHLVLLVKNAEGYKNLIYMVSKGFTEGFYSKPRIDMELLEEHHEGLIALSACLCGYIPRCILSENFKEAEKYALRMKELFGEDFFLEIQDHGISEQKKVISALCELSEKLGIGLAATNDVHYLRRADADAQAILTCIQTNSIISEGRPLGFESDEFYMKSSEEMSVLFGKYAGAVENTVRIAEKCDFDYSFDKLYLPKYPVPGGDAGEYLRRLCSEGLQRRLEDGTLVYTEEHGEAQYKERIEYELSIIISMGYAEYYLIVWDFIHFAKTHGIPVGPGRGSGAGSLVAFLVGITDVDSIKFGLFFERFLNPERKSMPDFDTDFCYDRRQEVIDYVGEKYGSDRISQIVTFGTMAARAVVRDVGRALGMPYSDVDRVAKAIPQRLDVTLGDALKESGLAAMYDSDPRIKRLIDTSMLLEGMPRHASTHAAGVVITDRPVYEYVPVSVNGGTVVTQFDMDTVASIGLLKFDFLGLRYLTIISDAQKLIRDNCPDFDIEKIAPDDKATFRLISSGRTGGVFQLESGGMRGVLMNLRPESIEDIMAVIALYRPGPMDSIPKYIENRKDPSKIEYAAKQLRPILSETFGCIVYQEQVMQIFRDIAGYTLGKGYIIIKAISKKKADVLAMERKNFIEGAVRLCGLSEQTADGLFEQMKNFASYAFNKSHAAAYSILSYRTAYLKAHYPREYFAALLSSVRGDAAKTAGYIAECKSAGVRVLPPDVNESESDFSVKNGAIRYGLLSIKNVGRNFIDAVIEERRTGIFVSFDDFIRRMAPKELNKRMVEALIKSGAFDTFGKAKSVLLDVYEEMIDNESKRTHSDISGQLDLFSTLASGSDTGTPKVEYPEKEELPLRQRLAYEKEYIGVYLSGHLLDEYARAIEEGGYDNLADIAAARDGGSFYRDRQRVKVAGIINSVTRKTTKKNEGMAFAVMEDRFGEAELIIYPTVFSESAPLLMPDRAVSVQGTLSLREDEAPKIVVNSIVPLRGDREAPEAHAAPGIKTAPPRERYVTQDAKPSGGRLYLKLTDIHGVKYKKTVNIIDIFRGDLEVVLFDAENSRYLRSDVGISYCPEVISYLEELLGKDSVILK